MGALSRKVKKHKSIFLEWLQVVSRFSSFHGLHWYLRTKNVYYKWLVFIVAIAAMIALPGMLILEAKLFFTDMKVFSYQE